MQVNLIASVDDSGYGTAGLGILRGLHDRGVEVALFSRAVGGDRGIALDLDALVQVRTALRAQRDFDPDAPCLRISTEDDMTLFAGRGVRAGLSFFETDRLTDVERRHLGWLDAVLVPSAWAAEVAVGAGLDPGRVHVVPMGVDRSVFRDAPLVEGGPTVFLNVAKWERRKGQDVLLAAFERAFGPDDDVELRLLCGHPAATDRGGDWRQALEASALADRIVVVDRQRSAAEVAEQMRAATCGVFPARAEGWNFPLLEMLSCGRPVIATDWGGHTQYLDAGCAHLLEPDGLEEAWDDRWVPVYSERKEGRWARLGDGAVERLAGLLRAVHDQRGAGGLPRNVAGIAVAEAHPWVRTADAVLDALGLG